MKELAQRQISSVAELGVNLGLLGPAEHTAPQHLSSHTELSALGLLIRGLWTLTLALPSMVLGSTQPSSLSF